MSVEKIQSAIVSTGLVVCGDIPFPTPLCKHHYHVIYNELQPSQSHCVTCGSSLKHTTARFCPNPDLIEAHLREKTGFDGHIKEADRVCFICYKFHLRILQQLKTISTDSDLKAILNTTTYTIPKVNDIKSIDEVVNAAIMKTVIQVGDELLKYQVMLLATAHDLFGSYFHEIIQSTKVTGECSNPKDHLTARSLLIHLTSHLKHHIGYDCTVRKYGTIIYRPNTNFVHAVSKLLWDLRKVNQSEITEQLNVHDQSITSNVYYRSWFDQPINQNTSLCRTNL